MKLSEWAKQKGITYKTAWRWFRDGQLPCPSEQIGTGTILVYPNEHEQSSNKVTIYGRVSSSDQKDDLERQMERLRNWCAAQGLSVSREVSEIGSGLNGKRRKLNRFLADPSVGTIVVEHRDRLARFGVPMLRAALEAQDREIVVINAGEHEDDLVQDFVDLATSMCARIYGKRSAKKRAEKAVEAADED